MAGRSELEPLYFEAIYRVALPTGVRLEVGKESPAVDRWLRENGFETAAYVTAANPRSTRLGDRENEARHERLLEMVTAQTIRFLPAESRDREGGWRETGLLLLGIDEGAALDLASELGQAAILALEAGRPVRLAWT
ncbi:MAG: DUF3293 domain-containing protein [Thermoanaerobaculia bacterium]